MSYNKRIKWKDHVVARPRTYTEEENADGSKTFTPASGEIIQQGTPQSATNFNKMEGGLQDVSIAFDLLATVNQAEVRSKNGAASAGKPNANAANLHFTNKQVPVSAFKADTTYADYPFRAAVALDGVLASMVPDVIFDVTDAVSGNIAPVAKSYDGGIYLYAARIPAAPLVIPTILLWRTGTEGDSGGGSAGAETYTGSYSMTPSFEQQELETQGKIMRDNVVAEEIPVAIVSNTSDGNTVIIGG